MRVPLTQGKVALVSPEDYVQVTQYSWMAVHINGHWYAARDLGGGRLQHMHTFLTGYPMTDHINNDGLDNQRHNLQPTNHQHNAARASLKPPPSGHRGVRLFKTRWRAQLSSNIYLGQFGDKEEAIEAYHRGAMDRYGFLPCGCEEVVRECESS